MMSSHAMAMDAQLDWYARGMNLRGQVVADVGANVGVLSQFFWEHGDADTRVVSIEPLPHALEQLHARARDQGGGDPRWRIEECAISDRNGTAWIEPEHDEREGWNSAVRASGPGPGRLQVPCHRLPELVPDATIVKLDVEGHEYAILDDALPAMPGVHTWAIELHMVHGRPLEDTLAMLVRHGYEVVAAGQRPGDRSGTWHDVPVPAGLGWSRIPVAQRRPDGSVFKMLHVLARRPRGS